LENRHEAVAGGFSNFSERMGWKAWKRGMLKRKWMNMAKGKTKNWIVNTLVKGWTEQRGHLHFPEKSFNEMWKERN